MSSRALTVVAALSILMAGVAQADWSGRVNPDGKVAQGNRFKLF